MSTGNGGLFNGAVATLLFGVVAVAHKQAGVALTNSASVLLKVALVAFAAAALLAVGTNIPMRYGEPDEETAASLLKHWDDAEERSL